MYNKLKIDRRFFLKGAGVSLALPMLNIMAENKPKKESLPPKRLACFFFPYGVGSSGAVQGNKWAWLPTGSRDNYKFTNVMDSLQDLKKETTIISGLTHLQTRKLHGHKVAGAFLTGTQVNKIGQKNTISLDQLYANKVGHKTRVSSLVMATASGVAPLNKSHTLSFNKSGKGIYSESNIKRSFNRLFGVTGADEINNLNKEKSKLDAVFESSKELQKQLGKVDKEKFENYLDAVREVEKRIIKAQKWIDTPKPKINVDINRDVSFDNMKDYIRNMYDLIWLAFETDSTRSATYMIGQEAGGGGGYKTLGRQLGLPDPHNISHEKKEESNGENSGRLHQFLVGEFAHFLNRLKSSKDSLDPLLDNTICLYGSSSFHLHNTKDYPLILAGGKNMGFKHGQFLKFDDTKTHLSNLYLTMAQQLGIETNTFSDSTETISDFLL